MTVNRKTQLHNHGELLHRFAQRTAATTLFPTRSIIQPDLHLQLLSGPMNLKPTLCSQYAPYTIKQLTIPLELRAACRHGYACSITMCLFGNPQLIWGQSITVVYRCVVHLQCTSLEPFTECILLVMRQDNRFRTSKLYSDITISILHSTLQLQ